MNSDIMIEVVVTSPLLLTALMLMLMNLMLNVKLLPTATPFTWTAYSAWWTLMLLCLCLCFHSGASLSLSCVVSLSLVQVLFYPCLCQETSDVSLSEKTWAAKVT